MDAKESTSLRFTQDNLMNKFIRSGSNHLQRLIKKFPNANWDWNAISDNSNITEDFIRKNLNYPWYWDLLSYEMSFEFILEHLMIEEMYPRNENEEVECSERWDWSVISGRMPLKIIKAHPELPWNWEIIRCENIVITYKEKLEDDSIEWEWENVDDDNSLTWDIILKTDEKKLNWRVISKESYVTWDIVVSNPERPWDYRSLSENKNIPLEIIFQSYRSSLLASDSRVEWNWHYISYFKIPNWKTIVNNPDIPFDYEALSNTNFITLDILYETEGRKWNWSALSENLSIPLDDVYTNLMSKNPLPWDLNSLSIREDLTIDFITKVFTKKRLRSHKDKQHIYQCLSSNSCISFKTIKENPKINWNWKNVSMNCSLTYKDVSQNLYLPWDWEAISENWFVSEESYQKIPRRIKLATKKRRRLTSCAFVNWY